MKDGTCPKCSATTIMPNVDIVDHGAYSIEHQLQVKLYAKPDATFFRDAQYNMIRAWICGTCGYAELYVDNPQALYEAYQEAQQRQQ